MRAFYFGNKERMAWVKAPAFNAGISKVGWNAEGVFLNGGAYARKSIASHKRYEFSWNLSSQEDIYGVLDYADGLYGEGLIYFLDPFARDTNLLPSFWAAPRLQAEDAPSLVEGKTPTLVDTAANTNSYPTKSAVYTIVSGDTFDELWVPVPVGYTLHLGVHGSATDTAELTYLPDDGSITAVTLLGVTTTQLTNVTVTGAAGVTLSAQGLGFLTLAGLVVQVLPTGTAAPVGPFVSGRGHSGCRFVSAPQIQGYSSALDKVGATAVLVETGAWE